MPDNSRKTDEVTWRECALWFLLAFTAYQLPGVSPWWVALVLGVFSVMAFIEERWKSRRAADHA